MASRALERREPSQDERQRYGTIGRIPTTAGCSNQMRPQQSVGTPGASCTRRPRGCCRGSTVPRSSRRWALTDCNRQLWAIQPQTKPRSICCRDAPKMLHDIWCRVGMGAVPEYSPVCVLALSIFNENENGRAWSCGSINVKTNCRHPSVDRQPTSQPPAATDKLPSISTVLNDARRTIGSTELESEMVLVELEASLELLDLVATSLLGFLGTCIQAPSARVPSIEEPNLSVPTLWRASGTQCARHHTLANQLVSLLGFLQDGLGFRDRLREGVLLRLELLQLLEGSSVVSLFVLLLCRNQPTNQSIQCRWRGRLGGHRTLLDLGCELLGLLQSSRRGAQLR